MCTKEQVQKDVEFGRMLARGPASPLIHVSTVTLSNDDRYKWFNQTLMTYGISALEQALKIGEGWLSELSGLTTLSPLLKSVPRARSMIKVMYAD